MPVKPTHDPAYLDEHHEAISRFAETYMDDEEEREAFVTSLLERRGYKQQTHTSWAPPDPQPPAGAPKAPAAPASKTPYFKR